MLHTSSGKLLEKWLCHWDGAGLTAASCLCIHFTHWLTQTCTHTRHCEGIGGWKGTERSASRRDRLPFLLKHQMKTVVGVSLHERLIVIVENVFAKLCTLRLLFLPTCRLCCIGA